MLARIGTVLQNVFKIPELRSRILFTLAVLATFRFAAHVPTPGMPSELSVGSASVAAPIFGKSQNAIAAVAIRAPAPRLPKGGMKTIAARLMKTSRAISHALGYRP